MSSLRLSPSNVALALTHARFLLLENLRVPIIFASTAAFPALSLLFFVVPFGFAGDAVAATTSVAQLATFGVLSTFLFTFGVGVADDREKAWDPYVRTLAAPPWPRMAGRLLNGVVFAVISIAPVAVLGGLLTAATAPAHRLALGVLAVLFGAAPFLFGGLAIGYSLPVKAALPVTQVVFFPIAFGGGLFLPPETFPDWLQSISVLLPSRGARELVVWAVAGTPPSVIALIALTGWALVTAALAGWAYRRDQGRRFR